MFRRYSTLLRADLAGPVHSHIVCFKADFDIAGARSLAEMQLAHDPMRWLVHTDCMKHQYHLMSRRHRFERKQLIG